MNEQPKSKDKDNSAENIKGINPYWRQIGRDKIVENEHRKFVGGMWDAIGGLQLEFLKDNGLTPSHKLIDIGCGCLRGGVQYISYLEAGNYYGLDINSSLIQAGRIELERAGLEHKYPNLVVNDKFEIGFFGISFDYAIAVSLFTHLPMNHIVRCLVEVSKSLSIKGNFYSTFFEAPLTANIDPILHSPGGITTYYDKNPFHYSFFEMQQLAEMANLSVKYIGDWNHPRNQKMLCFKRNRS